MPRSVDIILRHEAVERAKAGDKCTFVGTLIVVPDVSQLLRAGDTASGMQRGKGRAEAGQGVTGLKELGASACSGY